MIDMHVHILPGVDDGARDETQSRQMMRRAAEAGITRMICTPHVYKPSDQARNRTAARLTRRIGMEHGVRLSLGCEFNYRALAQSGTAELDAFVMGPTRCILLELGVEQLMPRWESTLSELGDHGYRPIIAHPERYRYIQRDIGLAQEMCALGCELQIDAGGLFAPVLSAERRTARRLLGEGMVSYIASDAHKAQDYELFEKAYQTFKGEWPRENRLTLLLGEHGGERA